MTPVATISAAIAASLLLACASNTPPAKPDPSYTLLTKPGTRKPASDLEKNILTQLDSMPADQEVSVSGREIIASARYHAASGRVCRSIDVRANGAHKAKGMLACHFGNAWSFVPDVVRQPARTSTKKVATP